MTHGRKWAKRIGLLFGALALGAGVYGGLNRTSLRARYEAHRLRSATTDDGRAAAAGRLAALGPDGIPYLVAGLRGDDPATCAAVAAALSEHLTPIPPGDPRFAAGCRPVLDNLAAFSEPGRVAALDLVPLLLQCPHPDAAARCRDAVRGGLGLPATAGKVRAIRLALRPEVAVRAEVVPLLDDPAAEVRRAAMLAVGPADDRAAPVIDDEALFKWLHDPDPEVRDLCQAALRTRGLGVEQIHLARQLTHPDPAERMKLLLDLQYSDAVKDPGPWLDRLSRDPEPAIRLGAARVGCELQLVFAGWLDQLADRDPDPTVRRWAGYYRSSGGSIRPAGHR